MCASVHVMCAYIDNKFVCFSASIILRTLTIILRKMPAFAVPVRTSCAFNSYMSTDVDLVKVISHLHILLTTTVTS
jgi:hypothetical protein